MESKPTVDLVQPTVEENEAFWKDVKDVCEKHSFVLSTGFSVSKAVKLQAIDKKDLDDTQTPA